MKLSLRHLLPMAAQLFLLAPVATIAEESNSAPASVFSKALAGGKHTLIVGKIKAAFADRKDVIGRYIRVHYDGTTLQMAGFVQSAEASKAAEEIATRISKSGSVQSYWQIEPSVTNSEPYATHVGEQSEDALTKARVLASLAAPDVRPQFHNAEIQHVTVSHGHVSIYVIADATPAQFDLAPHIVPIEGVKGWSCHMLKAYQQ
jgi:hypothetical protein